MPQLTVAGHPLHPILITLPAALLPFASALDLLYLVTRRRDFAQSASHALLAGTLGGLAAGAAGFSDFLEIRPESRSKRIGTIHGLMNVTILGCSALSLALRWKREPRSGIAPTLLSLVANIGVNISSWYGGHLVYEQGMRVKGQSEVKGSPELRIPGDERIAQRLDRLAS
jgi:uncharacterized membrane protein